MVALEKDIPKTLKPNVETEFFPPVLEQRPDGRTTTLLSQYTEIERARHLIFSGGACNFIAVNGEVVSKIRNPGRDRINDILEREGINTFDPQISEESHGRNYNRFTDGAIESAAANKSICDLYELNAKSFGAITQFEILRDIYKTPENHRVIYWSDIPEGAGLDQLYNPDGIHHEKAEVRRKALEAHYNEYGKALKNTRKYFDKFAKEIPGNTLSVVETPLDLDRLIRDNENIHTFTIAAGKIEGATLIEAYNLATKGEKVVVLLEGGIYPEAPLDAVDKLSDDQLSKLVAEQTTDGQTMRAKFIEVIEALPPNESTLMTRSEDAVIDKLRSVWNRRNEFNTAPDRKYNNLIVGNEVDTVTEVVYFGGAGNYVDRNGKHDNTNRDQLLAHSEKANIPVYESQITEATHGAGRSYNFETDHPNERAAFEKAPVAVMEVNPLSFGGQTTLEVLYRVKVSGGKTIIYANNVDTEKSGHLFTPIDILPSPEDPNGDGRMLHYQEMVKVGKNMRNYFLDHINGRAALPITVVTGRDDYNAHREDILKDPENNFVIMSQGIHALDLYKAFKKAVNGQAVKVYFPDGTNFNAPEYDPNNEVTRDQINRLLDIYVKEGSDLKRTFLEDSKSYESIETVSTEEKLEEALDTSWANRSAQRYVETGSGHNLLVSLVDTSKRGLSYPDQVGLISRMVVKGPVSGWIDRLGKTVPPLTGEGHIISGLPTFIDIPKRLQMRSAIEMKGTTRFGYGMYFYERHHANGKVEQLSRAIDFVPDSVAMLPVITNKETGERYIMTSQQFRDGTGMFLTAEAEAGSLDVEGEGPEAAVIRELIEESDATIEEFADAKVEKSHGALYISAGRNTERIEGYKVSMSLSSERIRKLADTAGGIDEGEIVQHNFYKIPTMPSDDSLSNQTITDFETEWGIFVSQILANDQDSKLAFLISRLQLEEVQEINRRYRAKVDRLVNTSK